MEDINRQPWECVACSPILRKMGLPTSIHNTIQFESEADGISFLGPYIPAPGAPQHYVALVPRPKPTPDERVYPVCRTCIEMISAVFDDSKAAPYFMALELDQYRNQQR